MDNELRNEIWKLFLPVRQISLATIDGDRPRVRPVELIRIDERFFVATGTGEAKIRQIEKNAFIEFFFLLRGDKGSGYVRASGSARILDDLSIKRRILEMVPAFSHYFKSADDPNYALIELLPDEIEYMPVGMDDVRRLKL